AQRFNPRGRSAVEIFASGRRWSYKRRSWFNCGRSAFAANQHKVISMSHPIPYELKVIRGNVGKRPLHRGPQPPRSEEVPEPPGFLPERPADVWRRLAPTLHTMNLLTVLDHACFAAYCASFGRFVDCERAVEREGLTARGAAGNTVMHPLVRIAIASAGDTVRYGAEVALSPSARVRFAAGGYRGDDVPPSPLDNLLA